MYQVLQYLNANANSRCVVEGEELLAAKLVLLCGVTKIEGRKWHIHSLCSQTSALADPPHQINGQLDVHQNVVQIDSFRCTCKAGLSGTCKHVSACLFYCSR